MTKIPKEPNEKTWSATLKKTTQEVLDNLPVASFIRPEGCFLKNVNGNYGVISMQDALSGYFRVRPPKTQHGTEPIAEYNTVEDLISDGWVID